MQTLSYHTLDTSELLCPWPLVHAKQKLAQLAAGEKLMVVSTDPSSVIDFKVFTAKTKHTLLKYYEEKGKFYFLIEKN